MAKTLKQQLDKVSDDFYTLSNRYARITAAIEKETNFSTIYHHSKSKEYIEYCKELEELSSTIRTKQMEAYAKMESLKERIHKKEFNNSDIQKWLRKRDKTQ